MIIRVRCLRQAGTHYTASHCFTATIFSKQRTDSCSWSIKGQTNSRNRLRITSNPSDHQQRRAAPAWRRQAARACAMAESPDNTDHGRHAVRRLSGVAERTTHRTVSSPIRSRVHVAVHKSSNTLKEAAGDVAGQRQALQGWRCAPDN